MELTRLHRTLAFEIGEMHTAAGDLAEAADTMAGAARPGAVADLARDVAERQGLQRRRFDATLGALGVDRVPIGSPALCSILEQRWHTQRHRLGHPLLEAYIVGTALQGALHYIGTVLALAAARAERLDEIGATQFLREAFDEVAEIRRRVARTTGVPAATIETAAALPPGAYVLERRYGH